MCRPSPVGALWNHAGQDGVSAGGLLAAAAARGHAPEGGSAAAGAAARQAVADTEAFKALLQQVCR